MKKWGYLVILCAFGFAFIVTLTGCATLTTGNSQSITIATKPQGATCTLNRDGKVVAVVNPTPGTVNIDKSKNDISIVCTKEGFQDETAACNSNFQGMTFGNILFGGLIGLAVDAGSGAMHKYPSELTILLIPIEFASIAERDAFFDSMKTECLTETAKLVDETSKRCATMSDDNKATCVAELKAAESNRDTRLGEIEKMRNSAKIKDGVQASLPMQ
jgi:hypothetical protein